MHAIFKKGTDFILSIIATIILVRILPNDALKNVTGELISFFSIQSAVILPAMIFTASILRPDGLELDDAKRYNAALKKQMVFWTVLLCLDFIAVVFLILCKALEWKISLNFSINKINLDFSWFFPSIIYFCGTLAIFRTIPFVIGILSLLDLNGELVSKSIIRRNKLDISEKEKLESKSEIKLPDGYGKILDSNEN